MKYGRSSIALFVGAVLLTACSGSAAQTAEPSTAASRLATTGSPAATVIPESELPDLDGLKYLAEGDDEASLETVRASGVDPDAMEGYLGRTITFEGEKVGGVQIFRAREPYPGVEGAETAAAFLEEYAQKKPTASTLAGRPIQQVDGARGSKVGAILWIDGKDIVIIWSSGISDARRIGEVYIVNSS